MKSFHGEKRISPDIQITCSIFALVIQKYNEDNTGNQRSSEAKLVGYTEKEIESFVQGAMFMAGNLPEKRSAEWYQKRE